MLSLKKPLMTGVPSSSVIIRGFLHFLLVVNHDTFVERMVFLDGGFIDIRDDDVVIAQLGGVDGGGGIDLALSEDQHLFTRVLHRGLFDIGSVEGVFKTTLFVHRCARTQEEIVMEVVNTSAGHRSCDI